MAASSAITEYKEFPGRPHFPGAPGWEEVADYALAWALEHAGDQRGAGRRLAAASLTRGER